MISYRTIKIDSARSNENELELSFSSTEPVRRSWGWEILDHGPNAVNLERLNNSAPLLLGHNPENVVGVVSRAYISGNKGRALVKLSRNREDIRKDIEDGILKNVSVGYQIDDALEDNYRGETGVRVTRWTPLEISLVSIPADVTVGINRKYGECNDMNNEDKNPLELKNEGPQDPTRAERHRVSEILAIGEKHNMREQARTAIENGHSLETFRAAALAEFDKRGHGQTVSPFPAIIHSQKKEYSLTRALGGMMGDISTDWGYEREVSQELARRSVSKPRGILVPSEMFFRTLTVGTPAEGGYLVGTQFLASEYIEPLRPVPVVVAAGARMLTGLSGDVAIPALTVSSTASWVAEDGAASESTPNVGQITLSPKTVTSWTSVSRRLMIQATPQVDEILKNDLARVLNDQIDYAAIQGAGTTNEPEGIMNNSSVSSVTTSGTLSYTNLLKMEKELGDDNALVGRLAFITTPGVKMNLKGAFSNATYGEIPLWQENEIKNGIPAGKVLGYQAFSSNFVPSTLGGGSSHGAILGNFDDLVIGVWSGVDIIVDPYTNATKGQVRLAAFLDCDIALRHAKSFCIASDITVS